MNEQLVEHADSRGVAVRVNREAGVIGGVKILGLESRNGRVYRPSALERSAALYEGARVNVNHPREAAHLPRGYEDRIGAVRNVHSRGDGLYGDFHFNPKHRLAEQLLWDAEHAPENVGFSHNVLARTSREGDKLVVEEITRVQSVDLVADPATTRGLFEETSPTATIWHNPSQAWVPYGETPPTLTGEPQRVALLEAENLQLRGERDDLRQRLAVAQRRAAVDARIAAASLPEELATAAFREQCQATADDQQLQRLLEARRQDAQLLRAHRPRSIPQHHDRHDVTVPNAAAFAAIVKG